MSPIDRVQIDASAGDTLAGTSPAQVASVLDLAIGCRLGPALRRLADDHGPAALLVDGLPMLDEPGPTPVDGSPTDDRLPLTTAIIEWAVETMGAALVAYPEVAGGRAIHDVNPIDPAMAPSGSDDRGPVVHHPDHVLLWCVRPAPAATVLTDYADGRAALDLLDRETEQLLREPRFRIRPPRANRRRLGGRRVPELSPIVSGPTRAPELRLHAADTECVDVAATRALADLVEALDQVSVSVELREGRMLIMNTRRGVYRRDTFTPTYGPDERWLLRAFLAGP